MDRAVRIVGIQHGDHWCQYIDLEVLLMLLGNHLVDVLSGMVTFCLRLNR